MKTKLLLMTLLAAFGLVSCDKGTENVEPVPEIKIDVSTIVLQTSEVGTTTTSFSVNVPWTITLTDTKASPSWFTVDKMYGNAGTHTITLTITEVNPSTSQSRSRYIKIVAGNLSSTITITQPASTGVDVDVTGVSLNKPTMSLVVGTVETLVAVVSPSDATNKVVIWSSSSPEVATVTNGIVTAVKEGEAVIKVRTEDGNKEATCTVTVTKANVAVTGMTLNQTNTSLVVGGAETLIATINPQTATNKDVTWSSSDSRIATVSATGVVIAKAAGTATITVRTEDGGKEATCMVTVVIPVTSVSLNKSNTSITIGSTETLTAAINPANATNKDVTWSSSDSKIASVSATGVVAAKAAGTATITVRTEDGGKEATCMVTVVIPVTSVSLNKSNTSITIGSTETLTAAINPVNATNKDVTWSSSDSKIASVSATGVVTAKAAGTVTITVITVDGSKRASCSVVVIDSSLPDRDNENW